MTNILIIIPSLALGGGAERTVSSLAEGLTKQGHRVSFFLFHHSEKSYSTRCAQHNLGEIKEKKSVEKFFALFSRANKIAKYAKKQNIQVIFSFLEEANIPTIFSKCYGNKARIIVSVRETPRVKSNLYKFFMRILYPYAYRVVALSQGVEHALKKHFRLKNTQTIYNMVDLQKVKESSKELVKLAGTSYLTIGRLNVAKGHWHLIKSFKEVVASVPDARLYILGDGELRGDLQKLVAALKLEKSVLFLGRKDNVFPYLSACDYFVLSSLWEGFGMVLIEALSLNKLVLSTDCDYGPREILAPGEKINTYPHYGKYGVLVKPFAIAKPFNKQQKNELALANALISLAQQKNIKNNFGRGTKRAADFSIQKICNQWSDLAGLMK